MSSDAGRHVFIVGSGRSGTTLLASILNDTGIYAVYRAETKLLDDCPAKYASLSKDHAYRRFTIDWFNSRQFRRSGLSEAEFHAAVSGCRNSYPRMLAAFMAAVARKQDKQVWIEDTPTNAFRLCEIAREFPNARVIHMVRDGRAVALSMARLGWTGVHSDNYRTGLCYSALKWAQSVRVISRTMQCLGDRVIEIRFEDLVTDPGKTIASLGKFLDVDLAADSLLRDFGNQQVKEDADVIETTANTAFGDVGAGISSTPAFRWKEQISRDEELLLNGYIGDMLKHYRYPVDGDSIGITGRIVRGLREFHLGGKRMLKQHTPLGRFSPTPLELGKS